MERGIWATWYDLEENDRKGEFLAWMHGEYLPFLRAKTDYLWVAHYESDGGGAAIRHLRDKIMLRPQEDVGVGSQYLLLVGADTPRVFLNPSTPDPAIGGTGPFDSMLGLRREVPSIVVSGGSACDRSSAARPAVWPDDGPSDSDGKLTHADVGGGNRHRSLV